MMTKINSFTPSKRDKEWMKRTLSHLKDGGVWATSYANYHRQGMRLACTSSIDEMMTDTGMNKLDIERNINRDRIMIESVGYEFSDIRKTVNN